MKIILKYMADENNYFKLSLGTVTHFTVNKTQIKIYSLIIILLFFLFGLKTVTPEDSIQK